ncbi:MAG: hypothetical protein KAU90_10875, partial [Sulfurovaceae bacterium]|nr:hypothetical protein [Sulfurovaceae bacterium]
MKKILKLILLFSLSIFFLKADEKERTCWVIDDQTETLYTFNMNTLDAPRETAIDSVNEGEGLAYRASTHELYMWDSTHTIVRNPDTGIKLRQYTSDYANEIEGASFYVNPETQDEELWVIVEDLGSDEPSKRKSRFIQQVDINDGHIISETRKKLTGGFMDSTEDYGNDIGSLAIDPKNKKFWITQDSGERKLANIDPSTGEISNVKTLTPTSKVDAEVLAFDDNGVMYTESDRGHTEDDARYLWEINSTTADISIATA